MFYALLFAVFAHSADLLMVVNTKLFSLCIMSVRSLRRARAEASALVIFAVCSKELTVRPPQMNHCLESGLGAWATASIPQSVQCACSF